jgi:hypothetical protein
MPFNRHSLKDSSAEVAVQVPDVVSAIEIDPPPVAMIEFDAIVIALDGIAFPPACFDAFGTAGLVYFAGGLVTKLEGVGKVLAGRGTGG